MMRQKKSARECALTILERSDRTEAEIRKKLKEKEYTPEEIEETALLKGTNVKFEIDATHIILYTGRR